MAGESGAEVDLVADIEGAEDADNAERRRLEDVDSGAGVGDVDGVVGVEDVRRGAGREGRSRPCVLCRSGTVAPMQRHEAPKEQGLHAEIVREILTRISKAPRMSTTPKGEGWKV